MNLYIKCVINSSMSDVETKIDPRVTGNQKMVDEIVRTSMNNEPNKNYCKCGIELGPKKTSGLCNSCYDYQYNQTYRATHKEEARVYRKEYESRPKPDIPSDKTSMVCSRCKIEKKLSEFYVSDQHRSSSLCIECKKIRARERGYYAKSLARYHANPEPRRKRSREAAKKPEFKLKRRLKRVSATMAEYEEAMKRSLGICENPGCNKVAEVCDHKEGKPGLRGLLCHPCNTALGLLYESSEIILGLAEYINTRTKE